MIFQGLDLVIGNIGDSRAILGTRDDDDSLIAVQLTVDLKPNLPSTSLSLSSVPPCVCWENSFQSFSFLESI